MMIKPFAAPHPKQRYIYAVTGGAYLGELLVYVEKRDDNYSFLSLPKMVNRSIPTDKFEFGIRESIVDIVEKLPSKVYKVCRLQHTKNVANNVIAT
jgi:hypothetical protein